MVGSLGDPRSGGADSAYETPRAGDVLAGKYRVERILGVGGMGIVLAVEHLELGQRMAIKTMLPGVAHDQLSVTRFLREARSAAGLQSEHVVRIFDVGTLDNGAPYMVMELLRGQDLSQLIINHGRLGIREAVDYVVQACHAIAEAHAAGIVHRDLKPSNLFLTTRSDGSPLVKVLDFGISKAMVPDVAAPNLTATSAIMGSPLYMSPEQVRNAKHVDARADVWSLGVILHELLSGNPAFQADTLPGICAAIIADEAPPLRTLRDDVPPELEAVVSRCLQKDARKRFQSTRELMAALRPLASSIVQASAYSTGPGAAPNMATSGMSSRANPTPRSVGDVGFAMGPSSGLSAGSRAAPTQHSEPDSTQRSRRDPSAAMTGSNVPVASSHSDVDKAKKSRSIVLTLAAIVVLGGAAAGVLVARKPTAANPTGSEAGLLAPPPPSPRRMFGLTIESTPSGADLYEGDSMLGSTPIQLSIDNDAVRVAPKKLVVRREGFLPYSLVQGPSDDNVRLFATLVPAPAASTATAAKISAPLAHAPPAKHMEPRPTAAPPPPPALPPAPSPSPPDIRLQR